MKPTIKPTDYKNIAKLIFAKGSDESETIEIEYSIDGDVLFIEVKQEVEYTSVVGGSFEDYDFERYNEVTYRDFDVLIYEFCNIEGAPIACNFKSELLNDILNN